MNIGTLLNASLVTTLVTPVAGMELINAFGARMDISLTKMGSVELARTSLV